MCASASQPALTSCRYASTAERVCGIIGEHVCIHHPKSIWFRAEGQKVLLGSLFLHSARSAMGHACVCVCRCAGRTLGAAKPATHEPAAQHAKLPAPAAPGMAATVQHPTAAFGSGRQEQQHPHRLGAWVLRASMQRALTAATCLPGGLLATVPQHAAQGALRPCAHLRLQQQRLLELAARQASTTHLPRRMLLLQQGLQQQRQQLEAVEDLGTAVWQAVWTWHKEAAVPRQCRRRCSACCCAAASPASSQLGSCWSARCCSPARRCGPCPLG